MFLNSLLFLATITAWQLLICIAMEYSTWDRDYYDYLQPTTRKVPVHDMTGEDYEIDLQGENEDEESAER